MFRPPDLRDSVLPPIFAEAAVGTIDSQRPRMSHPIAIS